MGKSGIIFASVIFSLILVSSITIPSYSDYTSPKKQLESGVLSEDVMCRENRILVIRDNGDPACVSEKTAEKKGWRILVADGPTDKMIAHDSDESKLSTAQNDVIVTTQKDVTTQNTQGDQRHTTASNTPSSDLEMLYDFEISRLPKLGETAILAINMTYPFPHAIEGLKFGFEIYDQLEFVDVEPTKTKILAYDSGMRYQYIETVDLQPNELKSFQVTIRAEREGYTGIQFHAFSVGGRSVELVIGEDETVYYDRNIHSHLHPANQRAASGSSEPGVRPDTSPCIGNLGAHPGSEAQYRAFLAEIGKTQEEIDRFIEEGLELVVLGQVRSVLAHLQCQGNTLEEAEQFVLDYYYEDDWVLDIIDSYDGFVEAAFSVDLYDDRFVMQCDVNSKQCQWADRDASDDSQIPELFIYDEETESILSSKKVDRHASVRHSFVKINMDAFDSDTILFNAFDESIVMNKRTSDNHTWKGTTRNSNYVNVDLNLSAGINDDLVSGNVDDDLGFFTIMPLVQKDLYIVQEIDRSLYIDEPPNWEENLAVNRFIPQ